ncbi:hypothetical protein PIB30_104850, partial [Stylosanthes scabra]|nr:hypothetical protein [Stylosanthes scabra]
VPRADHLSCWSLKATDGRNGYWSGAIYNETLLFWTSLAAAVNEAKIGVEVAKKGARNEEIMKKSLEAKTATHANALK